MKVRLKQLALWSLIKVVLVAGGGASLLFMLGLLALDAATGGEIGRGDPVPIMIIASLIIVGGFTLLHVVGLLLVRLLPWQGPAIEVTEDAAVSRVFE